MHGWIYSSTRKSLHANGGMSYLMYQCAFIYVTSIYYTEADTAKYTPPLSEGHKLHRSTQK